jgi:hypothetical protein
VGREVEPVRIGGEEPGEVRGEHGSRFSAVRAPRARKGRPKGALRFRNAGNSQ